MWCLPVWCFSPGIDFNFLIFKLQALEEAAVEEEAAAEEEEEEEEEEVSKLVSCILCLSFADYGAIWSGSLCHSVRF